MILSGTVSVFVDFSFTQADPEDDDNNKKKEEERKPDEPLNRGAFGKCVVTMNRKYIP